MSYEESFKHLEDQCACCICLDRYDDPASLPCGHSCCRSCLESILKLGGPGPRSQCTITCPICRKVSFLKGRNTLCSLPMNTELKEKLSILEAIVPDPKIKPGEKCQVCARFPKINADFQCLSCDVYYCSACLQQKHDVDSKNANHLVASLKVKDDGKNMLLCKDHKFFFRYFCKQCDMLICTECCLKGHKSHDRMLASQARQLVRGQVEEIFVSAKEKATKTENALVKCRESIKKFEDEGIKLRNDLRKEKRKVLSQVLYILNKVEDDYMNKFDNQVDYFKNLLQGRLDEAQLKHTKVASWKDALVEVLKIEDDTDFLAKAENAKKHVNEMKSLEIDDEENQRIHNLFHDTEIINAKIPNTMFVQLFNCLGELKIKGSRNARNWKTHTCPIDDNIVQEAVKQDGNNLMTLMKKTEPVTKIEPGQSSLNNGSQTSNAVSGASSLAASSASNTSPFVSFADVVQESSQNTRIGLATCVNVPSVFVAASLPSQPSGAQNANANHGNNTIRITNSAPSGQGVSASVPDVRMLNSSAGDQGWDSDSQSTATQGSGRGRSNSRGRGRGRQRGRGASSRRNRSPPAPPVYWLSVDSDSEDTASSASSDVLIYCHRCNRHNHTYKQCYADRKANGEWIRGVFQDKCYRCGRNNHLAPECYARYDIDGDRL